MSATRITVAGLSITMGPQPQIAPSAPAQDHSRNLFGQQDHCSTKQCGVCWRCCSGPGPLSTPVVPAGVDQVVEPRWLDGTWGGPIPDAAYEQHCFRCGSLLTAYGEPLFDADGCAMVANRCSTCGLYSGYSWTWDCPDDEDDEDDAEYDRMVREYSGAYEAHMERAARLRAGLPAQSETDADLALTYDLTEDDEDDGGDGIDAVALQNQPVICPACAGDGCSACDQGEVPAWAAADVVTLASGGSRSAAHVSGNGSGGPSSSGEHTNPLAGQVEPADWRWTGEDLPGWDDRFLVGTTSGGKTVSGWPTGVDPVECNCCRMRHGRAMGPGEHCGWCRGGVRHRIAVAVRCRLTRSEVNR